MILKRNIWYKKDYKEFLNYLISISNQDYKNFSSKIILGENIIGIQTPILKKIAREISFGNYLSFINNISFKYYEESLIYGFIIGYIKDYYKTISLLNDFIPHITNWAVCDQTAANLHIIKNNLEETLPIIDKLLKSNNPWNIRFGLVLLIDYYINDTYILNVLKYADNINNDFYYVKMANAWLISICYIKYPNQTSDFLKHTKIDTWTYNKAIQKIMDSKRITNRERENLKKLKK